MSVPVVTNTTTNTNMNTSIQNLSGNYLIEKQGEIQQCMKTYNDILMNDNGSEFRTIFLDPIYTQLKGKVCNPNILSKYIQNLVEYPDTITRIDQRLNNIEQRVNSITPEKTLVSENNGFFRKDTLTIFVTMIVFFVIIIILNIVIMAKK